MVDQVVDTVFDQMEVARSAFLKKARAAAIRLARQNGKVTVDDVHAECPIPKGIDGRVMGAVFRDRNVWASIGFRRSTRTICHGRPIQEFVLAHP